MSASRGIHVVVVDPSEFSDVEVEGELLLWREGHRFPVDDEWFDAIGSAVAADLQRWWAPLRAMTLDASSEGLVSNLSYVLTAGCVARAECLDEILASALDHAKLRCLVANALEHGALYRREDASELQILELFGLDRVVEAWLGNSRSNGFDFWGWTTVGDIVRSEKDLGFKLILALLAGTSDPNVVALVGAGPLEECIAYFGDDAVHLVVGSCRTNPGLRQAVASAWLWDDVSAESFDKLEVAAGQPLNNPNRQ